MVINLPNDMIRRLHRIDLRICVFFMAFFSSFVCSLVIKDFPQGTAKK